MLARTSRVAAGAATAVVVVVGGDAVVGHALELLLRGSGYDARFESRTAFSAEWTLRGPGLVLLAPGLDEWERATLISSIAALGVDRGPAIIELVPAAAPRSEKSHAVIPWPCRPEDLEDEIERALRKAADRGAGRERSDWPHEREEAHP